jgi:hypothetical protein
VLIRLAYSPIPLSLPCINEAHLNVATQTPGKSSHVGLLPSTEACTSVASADLDRWSPGHATIHFLAAQSSSPPSAGPLADTTPVWQACRR